METRRITLADNQSIDVPADEWPWIVEYTWHYDAINFQLYRTENGRTIYLFNELLKHYRKGRDLLTLSDGAVDAMFRGSPPYDQLCLLYPQYVEAGKDLSIVLPSPYDFISSSLAKVVSLYYRWLVSQQRWVLSTGEEMPDSAMLHVPRDDKYPYQIADEYPRLGEWMYGEWTGTFDLGTNPPTPYTYLDLSHETVAETLEQLMTNINVIHDYEEMEAFFEARELPLENLIDTVQLLMEQYPTPAR